MQENNFKAPISSSEAIRSIRTIAKKFDIIDTSYDFIDNEQDKKKFHKLTFKLTTSPSPYNSSLVDKFEISSFLSRKTFADIVKYQRKREYELTLEITRIIPLTHFHIEERKPEESDKNNTTDFTNIHLYFLNNKLTLPTNSSLLTLKGSLTEAVHNDR